jgi:hypothetical protein
MQQIIRELKRQAAGEKLSPEQLKGLIRAGYVYRNGDEHHLTDMGRDALAQPGAQQRNGCPLAHPFHLGRKPLATMHWST